MLFDTHIHLDRFPAGSDVDAAVAAGRSVGIESYLVPGVDRAGWDVVRKVVERTEGALAAYGLHPLAADEWDWECCDDLVALLRGPGVVAVGEIGLDRYVDVPIARQEQVFREQVQVAISLAMPIVIHCRKMPGRLLGILEEEGADQVGGIMHAFSGSRQTAEKAMQLGFVLSFGGAITYPEARRAIEVLEHLPDEAIVIETDAPDMAPHPHRGEVNRPVWLELVLARLAGIRGWSRDEAADITSTNARRILKRD
jgi:TatD DNase family protein